MDQGSKDTGFRWRDGKAGDWKDGGIEGGRGEGVAAPVED